ncbi:MAG: hypothetical protein MPJ78_08035 [Hyphomicrobiaceae bacterium]|nr:hypothetical protein [Hyphomicrobiaceae bacterium]
MRITSSQTIRISFWLFAVLAVPALIAMNMPAGGPATALAADEEKPPEIIAAHIRTQGFKCDKPKSAARDKKASKPDEPVWTLVCENATYRVREIPDQAAKVERVE